MLAADNWCIKVEEKVYGPYTSQQMRKFAHEGRLAAWSMISPAGGRTWREAKNESAFANFFGEKAGSNTPGARTFGKRDMSGETEGTDKANKTSASKAASSDPTTANFIVVFDVVSGAASRAEAAVLSLGPAFRIADNTWSVSCELTAVGVRNAVAPYLNPRESLFVIDATRGRTSWQNFAPELHAKITASYAGAAR